MSLRSNISDCDQPDDLSSSWIRPTGCARYMRTIEVRIREEFISGIPMDPVGIPPKWEVLI